MNAQKARKLSEKGQKDVMVWELENALKTIETLAKDGRSSVLFDAFRFPETQKALQDRGFRVENIPAVYAFFVTVGPYTKVLW